MFKIGKLFHVTNVVNDLKACDRWFDDVFAVTRYYHGLAKIAGRVASLIAVGDVIFEPMMPPESMEGVPNHSIKNFLDRFGPHFHAIAFYVDSVPGLATHLNRNNYRLWDVTGRPAKDGEDFAIWTHPKETPGQIEFAAIERNTIDPRLQPAWSNEFWRARHPLGIERSSHISVVVRDLAKAKKFYCDILGGKLIHEKDTPGRKVSSFVTIGTDTIFELAQPTSSDSVEARDLEKNGEVIHALTFKTNNLARASDFLKSKQMKPQSDGAGSITLGSEQCFGMVIGFSERPIPGDPRDN
jgi:catechol 2,3-dioxygenase-like lactoylglutathione lyase family enzyme